MLEVEILQSEYKAQIKRSWRYREGVGSDSRTYRRGFKGERILAVINSSHIKGLSLTASAATSTLGEVTGEGEVSYIAMEID